ncbi:hypothetical protein ACETWI_21265, partial [Aeromonas hydrophila]
MCIYKRLLKVIIPLVVMTSPSAMALPTEEDIQGIKLLCGAGELQSASVQGDVDAALKSWRNASANLSIEIAKKDIAGALGQVKNDSNLAPVYRIYIDCVKDSIQQFLEKEIMAPQEISISGHSTPLLRSDYASDEEIWKVGCDEAELDAKTKITDHCPSGQYIANSTSKCDTRLCRLTVLFEYLDRLPES